MLKKLKKALFGSKKATKNSKNNAVNKTTKEKNDEAPIQNNVYVKIVVDQTGWTYEKAKEKMDNFKAEHGVNYNTYVTQRFYRSSNERTKNKLQLLERKNQEYIDRVCNATGWTRDEAIAEMDRVKQKFGVSYFKYNAYRFFVLDDEGIQERLDLWKNNLQKQIEYTMEESGWTKKQVRFHMNKIRTVWDLPPEYYVLYRMWELSDEQVDTYARRKDSERLYSKYNDKEQTKTLSNKEEFDRVYEKYINRKYWINKDTTYEKFLDFIDGLDYIFCKPIDSGGGQGTEKILVSDYKPEDLYEYLINKDRLLIEEAVKQHPEIEQFVPGCVNTIRVVTLFKENECHFICASIRFGHSGIVDNFHKDGMACVIDLETGKIITNAIDRMGITYENHPVSGIKFKDFIIPNWDKVLKLAEDAIQVQPGVNYVGWDIAVTKDNAVIIEGNSSPDLVLIQAPYAREKIGQKHLFSKYF